LGHCRARTISNHHFQLLQRHSSLPHVVCFIDVTDPQTFNSLPHWLDEIERYGSKDAPKLIVANKCDLGDKTLVSSTEGKSFAEEMGFGFIETSAKTGMNVDDAFTTIVTEVIKRQQRLNPKYRANYTKTNNNNNPNPNPNPNPNHGIFSWVKNIFGSNDPLRGPPSQKNPNFKEVNPNQNPSNHNHHHDTTNNNSNNSNNSNNNSNNNNNVNNNIHNNQNNQNREDRNNTRVSDQTNTTLDGSTNDLDENDKTKSGPTNALSDSKQEPKELVSINL
jgi:hypothetical protein